MTRRARTRCFAFRASALVVAAALWAAPTSSSADEARAAERFRAGTEAFGRGDFREAASAFEDAHREAPSAASLYNAGRAWEAAGQPARAADAYLIALRAGGLAQPQEAGAKTRLAALEATVGRLEITAPAGATISVAHVERAAAPLSVHVAPGQHTVSVILGDGRTLTRTLAVAAGSTAALTVEAPELAARPAVTAAPPSPARGRPAPSADAGRGDGASTRHALGWVALGSAALASGAGITLGILTLDARDEYESFGGRDPDQRDRAVALRTFTNVAWIGAGALAVTGIVLLLTSRRGAALADPQRAAFDFRMRK